MRIGLVSDWMTHAGGAEAYMRTVREALRSAGHTVALFACGPRPDGSADYAVVTSDSMLARAVLQMANPEVSQGLRTMVREFRPDVVLVGHFAYHVSPHALSALGDVPMVIYLMDYKSICPVGSKLLPNLSPCREDSGIVCMRRGCVSPPHWLRDRPRYALIRRALARAALVLTPSATLHRQLATAGIQTTVLPQPVPLPTSGFQRQPAHAPCFVYVGRLSREKGVPLLIDAFMRVRRAYPDTSLRIAGDGPLQSELAGLVAATDGVALLGALSPEQVEAELSTAWALIAPSLWEEPFGLVALEAIVRGVPVIASDTGGFTETVVHGSTGLLFTTARVEALTASLVSIASGTAFPGARIDEAFIAQARLTYTTNAHVHQLIEIFARVHRDRALPASE
ncbi:MAG: glycosyltransferase family 4 protein [Gemmatimonadaceae bacterium]|nr:glycosyltransferase family 4 protein [Gemmatimonadaceae bacterium]